MAGLGCHVLRVFVSLESYLAALTLELANGGWRGSWLSGSCRVVLCLKRSCASQALHARLVFAFAVITAIERRVSGSCGA